MDSTLQVLTRTSFNDYVELAINQIIGAIPIPLKFNDTLLDTSLLKAPQIIDDYLPLSIIGKFNPVGEDLPFNNTAIMPVFEDKGESLQIYVSDFTFRSFTYTMQKLGYLTITIEESPLPKIIKFDTESFGYFIPQIYETYGKGKKCRLTVTSLEDSYPQINIKPGYINGTAAVYLDIDVYIEEEDRWEHAIIIELDAIFVGKVKVENNLIVTIDINVLQFKIDKIIQTNIGEVNTEMLNRLTIILSATIKYSVNLLFSRGLNVPLFLGLDIDLGKVDFKLQEGYFSLQSTPKFDSETNKKFVKDLAAGALGMISPEENMDLLKQSILGNRELRSYLNTNVISKFKNLLGKQEILQHFAKFRRTDDL